MGAWQRLVLLATVLSIMVCEISSHSNGDTFDPAKWQPAKRLKGQVIDNRFVQGIHGPNDALTVVAIRERVRSYVRQRKPVPTDVFLLSTGEPDSRSRTKVGGLPYWRRERNWPLSKHGKPLPFLAQFNFTGSRDLVGSTAGDILLIFAHDDLREGCALAWEAIGTCSTLVSDDEIPITNEIPKFFGTRCAPRIFQIGK